MSHDSWITFHAATLILDDDDAEKRLHRALISGTVRSFGIWWKDYDDFYKYTHRQKNEVESLVEEIGADLWASWVFLRDYQWLQPPEHAGEKECAGYRGLRLSREDVEKLATAATDRFPGRPSLKKTILVELRRRIEKRSESDKVSAEAKYLFEWVCEKYPNLPGLPGTALVVENQIREPYHRLRAERDRPK